LPEERENSLGIGPRTEAVATTAPVADEEYRSGDVMSCDADSGRVGGELERARDSEYARAPLVALELRAIRSRCRLVASASRCSMLAEDDAESAGRASVVPNAECTVPTIAAECDRSVCACCMTAVSRSLVCSSE
jgi:hypothetical protein